MKTESFAATEQISAQHLSNADCIALLAERGHAVAAIATSYVPAHDCFGQRIWKEFSVHFMVGDGRQDIAYRLPIMGTFDSLIVFNEPRSWGDEAIASHEFSTP